VVGKARTTPSSGTPGIFVILGRTNEENDRIKVKSGGKGCFWSARLPAPALSLSSAAAWVGGLAEAFGRKWKLLEAPGRNWKHLEEMAEWTKRLNLARGAADPPLNPFRVKKD
jgi:hypothetical protein